MKKILLGILVTGAVGGVALLATNAFFSDTETSTGNKFQAGAVDLTIDSTAHYDGMVCIGGFWADEDNTLVNNPLPGLIGTACTGTWPAGNLVSEKFFNLTDIKPGDYGENTISMHIDNNPVWACIDITNLVNAENGQTEPEALVDNTQSVGEARSKPNIYSLG